MLGRSGAYWVLVSNGVGPWLGVSLHGVTKDRTMIELAYISPVGAELLSAVEQ